MEHSRGLGSRLALSIPWGHHSRRDAARPLHAPVSWLRVSLPVRRPQLDQLCISRAPSLTSAAAGAEPRGHKGHTSLQYSSLHPEACFKRKDMNHTKALSHKMLWFLDFLYERGVCMELHYVHFRSGVPGSRLLCRRTHNYSKINSLMTSPKTGTNSKQNKRCSFL